MLKASPGGADFSGKSLNGLDLSGARFTNANFRAARMNRNQAFRAKLDGAVLDQNWALAADFSGASLKKSQSLREASCKRQKCDGADLSGARVTADLSRASFAQGQIVGLILPPTLKNQSMGLMRWVLQIRYLAGADFEGANLALTDLPFAKFSGAQSEKCLARGAEAGGGRFSRRDSRSHHFNGTDLTSARIDAAQEKAFAAPKSGACRLRMEAHREARSIPRIAPNQKFSNQIMHFVLNTGLRTCFEKFLDFFDSGMLQLFES